MTYSVVLFNRSSMFLLFSIYVHITVFWHPSSDPNIPLLMFCFKLYVPVVMFCCLCSVVMFCWLWFSCYVLLSVFSCYVLLSVFSCYVLLSVFSCYVLLAVVHLLCSVVCVQLLCSVGCGSVVMFWLHVRQLYSIGQLYDLSVNVMNLWVQIIYHSTVYSSL